MGYYYRPDPWTFIVSPDPIEGFDHLLLMILVMEPFLMDSV